MKTLKILSFIMALLTGAMFVACSSDNGGDDDNNDTPRASLVGTWMITRASFNGPQGGKLEFRGDNTMTLTMDGNSYEGTYTYNSKTGQTTINLPEPFGSMSGEVRSMAKGARFTFMDTDGNQQSLDLEETAGEEAGDTGELAGTWTLTAATVAEMNAAVGSKVVFEEDGKTLNLISSGQTFEGTYHYKASTGALTLSTPSLFGTVNGTVTISGNTTVISFKDSNDQPQSITLTKQNGGGDEGDIIPTAIGGSWMNEDNHSETYEFSEEDNTASATIDGTPYTGTYSYNPSTGRMVITFPSPIGTLRGTAKTNDDGDTIWFTYTDGNGQQRTIALVKRNPFTGTWKMWKNAASNGENDLNYAHAITAVFKQDKTGTLGGAAITYTYKTLGAKRYEVDVLYTGSSQSVHNKLILMSNGNVMNCSSTLSGTNVAEGAILMKDGYSFEPATGRTFPLFGLWEITDIVDGATTYLYHGTNNGEMTVGTYVVFESLGTTYNGTNTLSGGEYYVVGDLVPKTWAYTFGSKGIDEGTLKITQDGNTGSYSFSMRSMQNPITAKFLIDLGNDNFLPIVQLVKRK